MNVPLDCGDHDSQLALLRILAVHMGLDGLKGGLGRLRAHEQLGEKERLCLKALAHCIQGGYDLPVDDNVYSFPMVDVRPKSPLGEINDREIWTKLSKNIRYTDKIINALGENKTGRVFLRCVINKDGTMGDPVIEMSTAKELNEEAIRVVKSMPKWIPGFKKGVPVKTLFDVLITFKAPH